MYTGRSAENVTWIVCAYTHHESGYELDPKAVEKGNITILNGIPILTVREIKDIFVKNEQENKHEVSSHSHGYIMILYAVKESCTSINVYVVKHKYLEIKITKRWQ